MFACNQSIAHHCSLQTAHFRLVSPHLTASVTCCNWSLSSYHYKRPSPWFKIKNMERELVLLCTAGRDLPAGFVHGVALPAFDDVAECPSSCPKCGRDLGEQPDRLRPGVVSWQPCQCVVCLRCAWRDVAQLKGTRSTQRPPCPKCGRLPLSVFFAAEGASAAQGPSIVFDVDELIAAFRAKPGAGL